MREMKQNDNLLKRANEKAKRISKRKVSWGRIALVLVWVILLALSFTGFTRGC